MSDSSILLPRRRFLTGAALGGSGLLLSGCDALTEDPGFRSILRTGEALNKGAHRLIMDRGALAREFSESDISPTFKANGSISPQAADYLALKADAFAGYRLVIAAHEQGSAVFPLPGASAVLAALVLAGLPTDRFLFAGFLPHKGGPRETALAEVRDVPGSLVFFEGPSRLQSSLASMAKVLGDRPAAVTRELTKIHETCVRGTLSQLAADPSLAEVKGEIVIVVGPPLPAAKAQAESADELLAEALTRLSPGEAATEVAQALGLPRKAVYARLLAMKSAP